MYSLDVNFLKDRTAAPSGGGGGAAARKAPKRKVSTAEMMPAFMGGGVALVFLAIAGGLYGWVSWQTNVTNEKLQALEGEILALQQKQQQIDQLKSRVATAQRQTTGLAQVFARILPWSAIIEDVRARIPNGVQMVSFNVQDTEAAPEATPNDPAPADPTQAIQAAAPAAPPPTIVFSGYAESYDQVNYFLITLQKSAFIDDTNARITAAELVDDPNNLDAVSTEEADANVPELTLPKVVKYTIEAQVQDLTQLPSDQLITQLENKKNLGSVIRLKALREKGIL